jgi:hypothetical protein
MEEERNACRLLMGKPEGKRPLGNPRCSCTTGSFSERAELNAVNWLFS